MKNEASASPGRLSNATPANLKKLAQALNCEISDLMPPEPTTDSPDTDTEAGAA